jgi:hypothetical protein
MVQAGDKSGRKTHVPNGSSVKYPYRFWDSEKRAFVDWNTLIGNKETRES